MDIIGLTSLLLGMSIISSCLLARPQALAKLRFWEPPNQTSASILARYPGPVILRQSASRLVLLSLASLLGVAIGYRMFITGSGATVLWCSGLLSAFCAFAALNGLPVLTLDAAGFEAGSRLRTVRLNWNDVTRFYAIQFMSLGENTFVRYEARPGQPWLMLGGFNISADELAELMTQWRLRSLGK